MVDDAIVGKNDAYCVHLPCVGVVIGDR